MPWLHRLGLKPGMHLRTVSLFLVLRPRDLLSLHDILPQYTRYLLCFNHPLLSLGTGRGEEAILIEF